VEASDVVSNHTRCVRSRINMRNYIAQHPAVPQ
jgi:hypothetical protein